MFMKKIFCTILLLIGISGFNFPQSVNWVKILDKQYISDLKCTSNGYLFACSQYLDGLYKSTDSGATWTTDITFARSINKIAVDKNDIIYIATSGSSICKSTDLGTTWSVIFAQHFITSLFADNNGYVYAGGNDGKIIRSTNSGTSWDTSSVTNNSITSFTSTKNNQIFATCLIMVQYLQLLISERGGHNLQRQSILEILLLLIPMIIFIWTNIIR